ncbi:hypothetical protein VIGAN_02079400, partial [Vigna angularis var. angularis]
RSTSSSKKNYHQQTSSNQKHFKRKPMHKTYQKFANGVILPPWERFSNVFNNMASSSSLFFRHMKFKCNPSFF